ncbi:MAG: hypothetical protein ACRD0K_13230 [Egibacteraceae bacterium]
MARDHVSDDPHDATRRWWRSCLRWRPLRQRLPGDPAPPGRADCRAPTALYEWTSFFLFDARWVDVVAIDEPE